MQNGEWMNKTCDISIADKTLEDILPMIFTTWISGT